MDNTRSEFGGLLWIYVGVSSAVFAIVCLLVGYTIVRSRRRDRDPGFRDSWLKAEIVYAVVLAAIVAVLVAFTFHTENKVDRLASDPGLRVGIAAFQWQWSFTYPNGVNTVGSRDQPALLVVPSDTTIEFSLESRDVVHSFWIPELRFKRDAFPQHVNRFDLVFPDQGTFDGHCAEFCGLRHANMLFTVRVLAPDAFRAWLDQQRAAVSS